MIEHRFYDRVSNDAWLLVRPCGHSLGRVAEPKIAIAAAKTSHGYVVDEHRALTVEEARRATTNPVVPDAGAAATQAEAAKRECLTPAHAQIIDRHGTRHCPIARYKIALMATTLGRNDPCHCKSGKKYKKCCLGKDEERRRETHRAPSASPLLYLEDDDLDELSNSVIVLAASGRFDEALAACKRLLAEFPDVVDGLERSGMVHAKMGDHTLAADFYRQALAFITHPSRCDDYEDVDYYREQLDKEERLAGLR